MWILSSVFGRRAGWRVMLWFFGHYRRGSLTSNRSTLLDFPTPNQAVLRIGDFPDEVEPAFCEDTRRGVCLRQSVSADHSNLAGCEGVIHQRLGRFGRVSKASLCLVHAIGNLNDTFRVRRALVAAVSHEVALCTVNPGETVKPGIWRR